jgi:hypothetical protein
MKKSITSNLRPLLRAFYAFLFAIAAPWAMSTNARAQAETIAQSTGGATPSSEAFFGQGLTTPSGGTWNNVKFNFFSDTGSTPTAAGTLYIFTSQYNGAPAGLSVSGFLAKSTGISSGMYVFDPSLTLLPNTQYPILLL